MARAQQQKADLLTRRMYLACRKRDMMSEGGGGVETEADRLDVMRMADEILEEEEGLRDAGFVKSLGGAALLPERATDDDDDDDDDGVKA